MNRCPAQPGQASTLSHGHPSREGLASEFAEGQPKEVHAITPSFQTHESLLGHCTE